ncbi:MAG: response regulator transcription factor [Phycisphaerae bacterium]|nr:response regulator transcription factor [Phycisphaerae bacterium]
MINVLIVDDHPIVREGLSKVILQKNGNTFNIVGMVDSFSHAVLAMRESRPDLIIVDIFLNGPDGIELVKYIRSQKSIENISILVLSMHDESLYAERALQAGADGYIMKNVGAPEIYKAIDTVLDGKIYLSDKMATKLLRLRKVDSSNHHAMLVESLTDRELEVLKLLGKGLTTKQVASGLHLSIKTVETYCARIKEKMGLLNFNQLILFASNWEQTESAR